VSLNDLREEAFALTYCMKSMTYGDIVSMSSTDREWYLARLYRQLKKEAADLKSRRVKPHKPRRR
jgi:hypothetical protein